MPTPVAPEATTDKLLCRRHPRVSVKTLMGMIKAKRARWILSSCKPNSIVGGNSVTSSGTIRQCKAQARENPIAALSPAVTVKIGFVTILLPDLHFACIVRTGL